MPTYAQVNQRLPGIILVAALAIPGLSFPKRTLLTRLLAAAATVFAGLFLFGVVLGHQFHFTRTEDIPVLSLGFLLGLAISEGVRAIRVAVSRRNDARGSDRAA